MSKDLATMAMECRRLLATHGDMFNVAVTVDEKEQVATLATTDIAKLHKLLSDYEYYRECTIVNY